MKNLCNQTDTKRRDFLKIASVSALTLSVSPVLSLASTKAKKTDAYSLSKNKKALNGKRFGLVIDTRKLNEEINEKVIEVCHKTHNVPNNENKRHEIKWVWSEEYEHAFTDLENDFLSEKLKNTPFLIMCNHCEDPACVKACPTQATFKREDGVVLMDFHRCIGCRFCMAACPYGSRSFNYKDPRLAIEETNKKFPTRMKGVVEKCNLCAERLAVGKEPLCVEASEGAIVFGDLNDESSEARKLLNENFSIRRKVHLGTHPSVYYIV